MTPENFRLSHGYEHQALIHGDFDTKKTEIARAVSRVLGSYIVQAGDDVQAIERALGAHIGQNLYNTKHLIGKVIGFDGSQVILPSGTTFPARAANDGAYQLVA